MRLLTLGDYTIELMDTDLISVTKSVFDVENPEQRKSSFTKTITLPASRVNNQVFSSYFEVGMTIESDLQFNPFYNPTKKVKAQYTEDTIIIISGYAQLKGITRIDGVINYELQIFGENADFFKSIEGKKLSDLDLSEYDHEYTQSVIAASWTNASGYVYPQVKNGRQTDVMVGVVQVADYWKVPDFDLWFFVKTLWDKIWADAGFNYYSTFLNTDAFKKLVYKGDSSGMSRTDTEITNSLVSYDLATSGFQSYQFNQTIPYNYINNPIIFDILLQDANTNYNTTTGVFIPNAISEYDVYFTSSPVIQNTSGITLPAGNIVSFKVMLVDDLSRIVLVENRRFVTTSSLANNATTSFGMSFNIKNTRLTTARSYKWILINTSTLFDVSINAARFDIYLNKDYEAGDSINVNSLLSSEMTQKDFVMGLANMFNLYIEPYYFTPFDSNSGGYLTYLVEPRDIYYSNQVIDWTKKLDLNREFTILPVGGSKEKFIKYTYDLDKDYYNNLYNQRTGRTFGDLTIDIQNDFLSGTKEVKIPFSLMVVATNSDPLAGQVRALATDVKDDEFKGVRNDKSKPKIMYYNGLLVGDVWDFGDDGKGTGRSARLSYPNLSNFDNINDPDNDLCFGTPQEVYYTSVNGEITVSNQGLYNKYHKKGLEELNNKNSKIIECYMNLTPLDMLNLSLRPIYEISGYQYRLYEVIDYNGKETTKCRFLKLQLSEGVVKSNGKTRGGRGSGAWGFNPDVYHETGNLNDRVYGAELVTKQNVLTGGGIVYIPPDQDFLVMFSYPTKNISSDTILTGGEGSPLYIFADTTAGSVNITLPQEEYNVGKTYIIKKTAAGNNLVIKDYLDTTFDTITSISTSEYILSETQINKVR
jgi:hypothetical protein